MSPAGSPQLVELGEWRHAKTEVETVRPDAVVTQYRVVLENPQQAVAICTAINNNNNNNNLRLTVVKTNRSTLHTVYAYM